MNSYGMEMWDDGDVQEGKTITDGFRDNAAQSSGNTSGSSK